LKERAVDFRDAKHVFAGHTLDYEDTRQDYGEARIITVGFLGREHGHGGVDAAGPRPPHYSMRKCNAKEQKPNRDRFETA
jgi:uncharacterized DUF497 family protein